MNCCDEYGNCNQGRDCPVRKAQAEAQPEQTSYLSWISDAGLGMLLMLGSSLFMSSMIAWGIYWLMHR